MKYLKIYGFLVDNRILGLPSTVQEWKTDKRNYNLSGSVLNKDIYFRKYHEIVSTLVQKRTIALQFCQARNVVTRQHRYSTRILSGHRCYFPSPEKPSFLLEHDCSTHVSNYLASLRDTFLCICTDICRVVEAPLLSLSSKI
jgi:hypothetical protein